MHTLVKVLCGIVVTICLSGAQAQHRPLTVPGSNANIPEFGNHAMQAGSYTSVGACPDLLKGERELNALLEQKIKVLEARLSDLEQKVARGGSR